MVGKHKDGVDISDFVLAKLESGASNIDLALIPLPSSVGWPSEHYSSSENPYWVDEGLDSSGPMLQIWYRE